MSKPLAFSIAACLAFTGCSVFHQSPVWATVVRARIPVPRDGDGSRAYAEGLHRELKADRIEHKVVTYQYHYRSRLREDATAERTAVLYRDDTHPKYPWWLKDETSGRPLWLPNGSLEQQLRFYVHRDVEIVNPGHVSGDNKRVVTLSRARGKHRAAQVPRHTLPPVAEAPRGLDPDEVFRDAHGTEFNSDRASDREKMDALLRARNSAVHLPLR